MFDLINSQTDKLQNIAKKNKGGMPTATCVLQIFKST